MTAFCFVFRSSLLTHALVEAFKVQSLITQDPEGIMYMQA